MGRSTAEGVSREAGRRTGPLWGRRVFLALLAVTVVAGLFGLFGIHSHTVSARSSDGSVVSVRYAAVARAGLGAPFEITVRRDDRFSGPVTLSVSREYLALFDIGDVEPQPSSSTATDDALRWEFDRPPGSVFVVTVDLTVQSGRHWGRSGYLALLDGHGQSIARITFRTWLGP